MYRRIVVPVDGSAHAEQAVPHALSLAQAFDADVVLCYVITAPDGTKKVDPKHDAVEYVQRVARTFRNGDVRVSMQIQRGEPALQIRKAAQAFGADAIVMATRSRRGVERLVLGSVAEAVVRDSKLPVLLVSARRQRLAKAA